MRSHRSLIRSVIVLGALMIAGMVWLFSLCEQRLAAQQVRLPGEEAVSGNRKDPKASTPLRRTSQERVIAEVTPALERVGPQRKEPVDLDSFGDITDEFFSGQPNPRLTLEQAVAEGKSEQELFQISQELSRKAQQYWREKRESLRQIPENADKTNDQLDKKLMDRHTLLVEGVAVARAMRSNRASFHISGAVVDESGDPIRDVEVEISKEYGYMWGWGAEWQDRFRGTTSVSGPFALRVDGATTTTLEFRKSGYYRVRKTFTAPPPVPIDSPEILANRKVPPAVVDHRDL
ncbi:MAG: carboxypeptidase-like regulatory domain-containing protein, partial [Planctomycetota bacterium]